MAEGDIYYTVPLCEIMVYPDPTVRAWQVWKASFFYKHFHTFYHDIVLDKDFVLVDGYDSYKAAKKLNMENVNVRFL